MKTATTAARDRAQLTDSQRIEKLESTVQLLARWIALSWTDTNYKDAKNVQALHDLKSGITSSLEDHTDGAQI